MIRFLRKFFRSDYFQLENSRIVVIDGHEMVIVGFSGNGPWSDLTRLSVEFEPLSRYTN